jgi:stearoyl-CoA desaturase (delta-9 desaturase)
VSLNRPSTALFRPAHADRSIRFPAALGFLFVHVMALGVLVVGVSWEGVVLCLSSYYLRMFFITAGFHRYFAHRSYRLGRAPQFLLAFLAQTSAQKGVLWWAGNHRHHHRWSDTPRDLHSPLQDGFFWSHIGWILSGRYDTTDLSLIPDFARFPELRWLDRNQYAPVLLYGLASWLLFGWTGLFWGFFLSTVLLWHGTFFINSLTHVFGARVFPTPDTSRNSFALALLTMGEGWHNNHHYWPSSAAQGFRWWQIDTTFYLLWLLEKGGLVRDLRRAPTPSATDGAFAAARTRLEAAGGELAGRIDRLSKRWEELADRARLSAEEAVTELEEAKQNALRRLEALHADYVAALERAGSRAGKRLTALHDEILRTREDLAGVLARLVEAAERALPA